jgi:hypothetical protein
LVLVVERWLFGLPLRGKVPQSKWAVGNPGDGIDVGRRSRGMMQGSRGYWGAGELSSNNWRIIFTKYVCRLVAAAAKNPPLDIYEGGSKW